MGESIRYEVVGVGEALRERLEEICAEASLRAPAELGELIRKTAEREPKFQSDLAAWAAIEIARHHVRRRAMEPARATSSTAERGPAPVRDNGGLVAVAQRNLLDLMLESGKLLRHARRADLEREHRIQQTTAKRATADAWFFQQIAQELSNETITVERVWHADDLAGLRRRADRLASE